MHMQTNTVTTKPTNEVLAAIQALDLESVKTRLMDRELGEGWTREYADSVEDAYKTFLSMVVKHQDRAEEIMLSKDVDEFWHTHILQTMKYADDCEAVFGKFLHHAPHVGELTSADHERRAALTAKTRELYEREFGGTQNAEAAWAGHVAKTDIAVSNVAIRADEAAVSNVAIRALDAAVSNVAIHPALAAVSNVAIEPWRAAVSNVAIHPARAAVSNVAIHPVNAAVSNVAIDAAHAAVSNVAFRAEHAAVSNVAMRAENAAVSNVAIRAGNAAVSNVAIRAH
jgi:hypothetical protein